MAKKSSKSATTKKASAEPKDPNEDIKSCKTLGELFDLRPDDQDSERYQVWVAKGLFLAKEAGVKFGPM